MKKTILLSLLTSGGITLLTGIVSMMSSSFSVLLWSNRLTMVGLCFLIIGLFLAILQSGTFDFFVHSLQSLRQLLQKSPKKSEPFLPEHGLSKKVIGNRWYFLIVAGCLFIISILLIGIS